MTLGLMAEIVDRGATSSGAMYIGMGVPVDLHLVLPHQDVPPAMHVDGMTR
jgi:hypothetical protein